MKPETSPKAPAVELAGVAVAPVSGSGSALLEDVTWRISHGDYWAVGGLHWAGKTALLMTAAALQAPLTGKHFLFGKETETLDEEELVAERVRLGVVFEDGGRLFSHLSVAENVALPLCYHRNCTIAETEERVLLVLESLGLLHLAHDRPGRISRNWRQRVGLARALALAPEVLLLDNPITGLDPRDRAWWLEFLDALAGGHKIVFGQPTTLVVVADDLRHWTERANQFAVIKDRRWMPLGDRAALGAAGDPLLRELLSGATAD
ncbi:MAG: ATP-binding cassette domain-containing protein [Verrucomicrobiota bacterium]